MGKNSTDREPTKANGYPYGRPEGVDATELDRVIERAIEKLPMELRLYPDVYAWRISAAVNEHFAHKYPEIPIRFDS